MRAVIFSMAISKSTFARKTTTKKESWYDVLSYLPVRICNYCRCHKLPEGWYIRKTGFANMLLILIKHTSGNVIICFFKT